MKRYEELLTRYEIIKEKYDISPQNVLQNKILFTIATDLNELKEAISKNDNRKIIELTIKIQMFLDGFKLFPTHKPTNKTKSK